MDSAKAEKNVVYGVFLATLSFGFSYHSIGFPILTAAQSADSTISGLVLFPVFMASSSVGGFLYSRLRISKEVRLLGYLGYTLTGVGTLLISLVYLYRAPELYYYLSAVVIGLGTSGVETFEPTIISKIIKGSRTGSGVGYLTSFISIGLFTSNILMGLLYYEISPLSAYLYAGLAAILGGLIILFAGRKFKYY
ncbi:MFS transporter [Thermoplasma volcanium]|uniref:MFS transporter n=1 Tax=Thermoplasma volcanium TaxID=50339 RepID=UPI00064FED0E|nr:MFS transporter [Thermoplasma volcanium]